MRINAFSLSRRPVFFSRRPVSTERMRGLHLADKVEEQDLSSIFFPEPTMADVDVLKGIYSEVATAVEAEDVEQALRLVSSNMGFVFRHNVPK